MQKVFNAISLLTFIAVGAQVVGVVYLVNNQDSIKEAIIKEAVTAVMGSISLPGLGGDLPIDAPIPSVMPEAAPAPEIGLVCSDVHALSMSDLWLGNSPAPFSPQSSWAVCSHQTVSTAFQLTSGYPLDAGCCDHVRRRALSIREVPCLQMLPEPSRASINAEYILFFSSSKRSCSVGSPPAHFSCVVLTQ